jgi:hypothetical protein
VVKVTVVIYNDTCEALIEAVADRVVFSAEELP